MTSIQKPPAAHTPSPWRIGDEDHIWRIYGPGDGDVIGELEYIGGNAEANARLIAAAPTLLAALEAISNEADEWDDHDGRLGHVAYSTLVQARAAIAAARGEG